MVAHPHDPFSFTMIAASNCRVPPGASAQATVELVEQSRTVLLAAEAVGAVASEATPVRRAAAIVPARTRRVSISASKVSGSVAGIGSPQVPRDLVSGQGSSVGANLIDQSEKAHNSQGGIAVVAYIEGRSELC